MGEVVNLRAARKAKARGEREAAAARNRALHGRPKAERVRSDAEADSAARRLEGHRLPGEEPDGAA